MVQEHGQQSRINFDNVADMAKIHLSFLAGGSIDNLFRWTPLRVNDVAVHTGQSDSFNSAMAQRSENVRVDFPGKDHFGHLQRLVISDATAFNDGLLHS